MPNFKITLETPRTITTRHGSEVVVDTFTSFLYGPKNREAALQKFGSVEHLAVMRKQGLQLNRQEFKQAKRHILVERI
jgi:hypothetical protein